MICCAVSSLAHSINCQSVTGRDLTLCGLRPAWVERWWSPRWLLATISIYVFFQSMMVSGLIPVVLSSLERRYGLSSKQTGMIVSLCVRASNRRVGCNAASRATMSSSLRQHDRRV